MLRSEYESHIQNWSIQEAKVYYYRGAYPWFKEIVILIRIIPPFNGDEKEFECLKDASTIKIDSMTVEEIKRLLSSNILIFKEEYKPWFDYKHEKTGGCTCGSWAVPSHTGCHSFDCKLYKK